MFICLGHGSLCPRLMMAALVPQVRWGLPAFSNAKLVFLFVRSYLKSWVFRIKNEFLCQNKPSHTFLTACLAAPSPRLLFLRSKLKASSKVSSMPRPYLSGAYPLIWEKGKFRPWEGRCVQGR